MAMNLNATGDILSADLPDRKLLDEKSGPLDQVSETPTTCDDEVKPDHEIKAQPSYEEMVDRMTRTDGQGNDILASYINNFSAFSGLFFPPYMIKALHEITIIEELNHADAFAKFMEKEVATLKDESLRSDPLRFYETLAANVACVASMLQTMVIVLSPRPSESDGEDGQQEDDENVVDKAEQENKAQEPSEAEKSDEQKTEGTAANS